MARRFLTPIDLTKLEIRNAVFQNLATDPATPVEGQFYYDTGSKKLKIYNGTSFQEVGGSSTEEIQDIVGALVSASTGIRVIYDDTSNILGIENIGILSLAGTSNKILVNGSTAAVNSASVTLTLPDLVSASVTGNAATASKWHGPMTLALAGDVAGQVSFDGSSSASITTTIQPSSVALGVDTTGNYVAGIYGTANQIEVTGSGSASAAVVIGLPNNVTIPNDLTVLGGLTVSGSVTFLNVEAITIEDNVIVLNYNSASASIPPVLNAGIEVYRGASSAVSLIWNESDDQWTLTNNGTNFHKIIRSYASSIGNGSATSITVTHNLGTRDVSVQVYENSGNYDTVETDVQRTSENSVTLIFAVAPTSNQYRVVVSG